MGGAGSEPDSFTCEDKDIWTGAGRSGAVRKTLHLIRLSGRVGWFRRDWGTVYRGREDGFWDGEGVSARGDF